MYIDNVSKRAGYIAGLIDGDGNIVFDQYYRSDRNVKEVQRRVCFSNINESIVKAYRDALDSFSIKSSVVSSNTSVGNILYQVNTCSISDISIFYSQIGLLSFRQEKVRNMVEDIFRDGDMPVTLYDTTDYQYRMGWVAGFVDAEGTVYPPRNYSISICNTDKVLMNYLNESLSLLGISYKTYSDMRSDKVHKDGSKRKDVYITKILRAEDILRFSSLVPIQGDYKRANLDLAIEWINRQRTKYSNEELIKLHIDEGLSLSEMCERLGLGSNSSGRLANQLRKAGCEVKLFINRKPRKDIKEYIPPMDLPKVYERLSKESCRSILKSLGINTTSSKVLDQLERHGYDVSSYRRK
jgi:hypothetical protein